MDVSHQPNRRLAPETTSTDEQRARLVQSAYQLIVEKGMAGLRIREVAARIGLNHATLLYYFPTKEALIQAVVAFCIHQFQAWQMTNATPPSTSGDFLRQVNIQEYITDLAYQLRAAPELFLVLDEMLLYARRDPLVHAIFSQAVAEWQSFLERLMQDEVTSGRFRPDLDIRSAALTLMTFCQGIGLLLHTQPGDIDGIIAQISCWFDSLSTHPNQITP